MTYNFFKNFLDFSLSLIALFVLNPIFIAIFCFIKIGDLNSPAIFKGERTGLNNVPFKMYKFRTMKEGSEKKGFSTALNDERLTKLGSFLRKYKLDELPQFFNVLKGEMSIIGPRPQVKHYTDKYDERLIKILSVKPGITDIASIYFSNMDETLGKGNVEEKYQNDIEPIKNELRLKYVEKQSLKLDSKIFLISFLKFFRFNEISVFKMLDLDEIQNFQK